MYSILFRHLLGFYIYHFYFSFFIYDHFWGEVRPSCSHHPTNQRLSFIGIWFSHVDIRFSLVNMSPASHILLNLQLLVRNKIFRIFASLFLNLASNICVIAISGSVLNQSTLFQRTKNTDYSFYNGVYGFLISLTQSCQKATQMLNPWSTEDRGSCMEQGLSSLDDFASQKGYYPTIPGDTLVHLNQAMLSESAWVKPRDKAPSSFLQSFTFHMLNTVMEEHQVGVTSQSCRYIFVIMHLLGM